MKRTKFNWELSRKSIQVIGGKPYSSTHWKSQYSSLQAAKDYATYQNFNIPLKWTETGNGYISKKTRLGRYKIKRI